MYHGHICSLWTDIFKSRSDCDRKEGIFKGTQSFPTSFFNPQLGVVQIMSSFCKCSLMFPFFVLIDLLMFIYVQIIILYNKYSCIWDNLFVKYKSPTIFLKISLLIKFWQMLRWKCTKTARVLCKYSQTYIPRFVPYPNFLISFLCNYNSY